MSELSSVELIALNLCKQEQLEDGYPVSVSLDQVEGAALYRTRARGLIAALAEAHAGPDASAVPLQRRWPQWPFSTPGD